MDIKKTFNKILPHILIILGFVALSYAYFSPVLAGKQLPQMDDTHTKGMSNEIIQYEKDHPGEHPMWTNSMFGGMPSYLIKGPVSFNIYGKIYSVVRLYLPYRTVGILFVLLLGFYVLLISLKANKYLSIAGAIGFAFATFNIMIISVGHITQAYAIAFVPWTVAGFMLLFDKKYLFGGLMTVIGLGLEVASSHPQITYYCFLIVLTLFIVKFVYAILEKELKHFFIVAAISVVAVFLAILPNIVNLWTTYEYGKYSIRGGSELSVQKETGKKSTGLEKDYALSWSYGVSESFSVLVPNIKGAGVKGFKENSKTAQKLQELGLQDPDKVAASLPVYWGDLPWTDSTVYFGAIICFIFVFGLFVVKGANKWWLLIIAILSFTLAWGKHFPVVSNLFFDFVPGYNKFRTVEMIIVIANFAFPLLGFLALKKLIEGSIDKNEALKALKYSLYIVGGLLLIFILVPGWFFSFSSNFAQYNDSSLADQLKKSQWSDDVIQSLLNAMHDDRKAILRLDSLRSLFYIVVAAGFIWAFISKKINAVYLSAGLIAFILVDQWSVNKRIVNNNNFVDKEEYQNQISATKADDYILQDKSLDYRVLNLTQSPFNDAYTPYFHKSIGGYHGAKMRRYQDLIEGPITSDLMKLQTIFQKAQENKSFESITQSLKQLTVLNMLNTKYIIYNGEAAPLLNTAALGNAWFVHAIKWVDGPDAEYAALSNFNPDSIAIVDKKFEKELSYNEPFDSTAKIELVSYAPNKLEYTSTTKRPQLAVFSEIYYDKGWDVFIDGKPAAYGRADYILRAMIVPEGNHKIEFKFEPKSVSAGQKIALASSILVILLVIVTLYFVAKKNDNSDDATESAVKQ
jgi:hypothetical protein